MKNILARSVSVLFLCLFSICFQSLHAQATYRVVQLVDTISESNAGLLVAKIVTSSPSPVPESLIVSLKGGTATSADFNGVINTIISFPANKDTANFFISVYDDFLPEFTETATFVLKANSSGANIDADSLFTVYIKDNDLPATIGFLIKKDSIWENQPTYTVRVVSNNPNPTPVQAYIRADDNNTTLVGGGEFTFFWQFLTFGPGLDTATATVNLIDDFVQEPLEYLTLKLSDFGANQVVDSAFVLYIKDDETPQPIFVRFNPSSDSLWEEEADSLPVYIEIFNPTTFTYEIQITRDNVKSTAGPLDFFMNQPAFLVPPGMMYDTVYIEVRDDAFVEPTETAVLRVKYEGGNLSPDSLFTLYIKDRDTVKIGFLGAAYSFVEDQGRCKIQLLSSSPMPYDISVPVTYFDGNATPGVDFLFTDTLVTFPANSVDTQAVYITILDDSQKEANEQVILAMGAPSDAGAKTGILQYTFFIIDDDTIALSIDEPIDMGMVCLYPNPTAKILNVCADVPIERLAIYASDGRLFFENTSKDQLEYKLEIESWTAGNYLLQISTEKGFYRRKLIKN